MVIPASSPTDTGSYSDDKGLSSSCPGFRIEMRLLNMVWAVLKVERKEMKVKNTGEMKCSTF